MTRAQRTSFDSIAAREYSACAWMLNNFPGELSADAEAMPARGFFAICGLLDKAEHHMVINYHDMLSDES